MTSLRGWRVVLRSRLVVACQLAVASAACAPEPPKLVWTIGFDETVPDADKAAAIDAWIMRGGCGTEEHLHDFELSAGISPASPKTLPPGTYGFAAEARDQACRPLATGCVERVLPEQASTPIEIVLRASGDAARCEPHACIEGYCVADAGASMPDSGGALDAGALSDSGAGLDASFDAQLADGQTGTVSEAGADGGDSSAQDCPEGIRRPGGHCYYFYDLSLGLADARELCELRGAYVVIFDNADEETWVTTNLAPPNDFWLGITDTVAEGFWMTELGEFVTYTNWDAPNPNDGRAGNCARYYVPTKAWRDGPCTDQQRVICELP